MFMQGFSGDLEGAHAKATQLAGEAVANMRTVAAFNSEAKIVNLFMLSLQKPLRRCFWKGQIAGSGFGVAQFLLYASYAVGLWYASWLVKHGISDFSKTIRVFMVLMVSANGAAETLTLAPDFIKGGRAMKSVFDLLDRKTEIEPDEPENPPSRKIIGEIEFRNVRFAYPLRSEVTILDDFTLRIEAGSKVALVGPSGAGKSSVLALLLRFYLPLEGSILIDGRDITRYNLRNLRRQIGLVQQEPLLFSCSIRDNICYGSDGSSESEVIQVSREANIHEFVSNLPDGYETVVGEKGCQLSGGQKQRIAIARTLLKNPAIMLLDEATSALDAESERAVMSAMESISPNGISKSTQITVAHRLSTVVHLDKIVVMEKGKVVEMGTHSALVAASEGVYSRFYRIQSMK